MCTLPDGDKGLTVNEILIKDGRCWVSDEYADRLKKAFRAERRAAFKRAIEIVKRQEMYSVILVRELESEMNK